jgi:hypothetical protein
MTTTLNRAMLRVASALTSDLQESYHDSFKLLTASMQNQFEHMNKKIT